MRLTELEPRFISLGADGMWNYSDRRSGANGLWFLCPKCFAAKGGRAGTHGIMIWTPPVPPHVTPGPGRWEMVGAGFDDLSLRASSSSVLLMGGCNAHFFINNGAIEMCP